MITFIEYWREGVRDKMLALAQDPAVAEEVRAQLVASGKAIDQALARVVDYAETAEDRREGGAAVHVALNQVRALNQWLGRHLFGSGLIWDPDARISAQALFNDINRACNCYLSPNWWPAAATIRYAEPAHTHAEIVGCAPWFRHELFYEGEEDDRHQIQVSVCGYLDTTSTPPDLIITEIVAFAERGIGKCQAVEFLCSSQQVMGMSPDMAWHRELDRMQKRSSKRLESRMTEARAHLLMDRGVVH